MAKSGVDITIDNIDVYRKIESLIKKVENPKPLLMIVGKYIQTQTKKMFIGRRPDTGTVRGESWPKLAESTIQKKLAAKKSGFVVGDARRPLVATGVLKGDLLSARSIKIKDRGLEYGTDRKSAKGFSYPAAHQIGGRNLPQRRWLFLTSDELMQIATTTRDWLMGVRMKVIE